MTENFTVFEYLYRDAGNYKAWGSLLLTGTVSAEHEAAFRECLDSGEFFVAEQVGVPSLQQELWKLNGGPTQDDHGFHEFHGFRPAAVEDLSGEAWGSVEKVFEFFKARGPDLLNQTRPSEIPDQDGTQGKISVGS